MKIDRKKADELAAEIISLLPEQEFKTHHACALAAMVLFARNMSEEQLKVNSDIHEIFEKNIPAMRAFVKEFHMLAAASSETMLSRVNITLNDFAENAITNAKLEAVREMKKSLAQQIALFNEKIPLVTLAAVKSAIESETQQLKLMKDSVTNATNISGQELLKIVSAANNAVEKIDRTMSILEARSNQLVSKSIFQRILEIFLKKGKRNDSSKT